MKSTLLRTFAALVLGVFFLASVTYAQEKEITIKGILIDNMCAQAHKDHIGEFVKTHSKECAIAPGCIDSGYLIYSEGKLYKFDKDSGVKIGEFLKKDESRLEVVVVAKKTGDELSLVEVRNRS